LQTIVQTAGFGHNYRVNVML